MCPWDAAALKARRIQLAIVGNNWKLFLLFCFVFIRFSGGLRVLVNVAVEV